MTSKSHKFFLGHTETFKFLDSLEALKKVSEGNDWKFKQKEKKPIQIKTRRIGFCT